MILCGDSFEVLKTLPDKSVRCCVTSPPYYGLRDYGTGTWVGGDPNCKHRRMNKITDKTTTGHAQEDLIGFAGDAIYKDVCPLCGAKREDKQIGLELTPEEYIDKLVAVFTEVHRVLTDDGTLWLNIGDSYSGSNGNGYKQTKWTTNGQYNSDEVNAYNQMPRKKSGCKPKDLIGIPWMLAFALRDSGWYLRQDIIWEKVNPMPSSVKDRCTSAHEYIFLLSKSARYHFNQLQEPAAYDGRHDTVLKKSIKYSNSDYLAGDVHAHGMAMGGRERWSVSDDGEFVRNKRDVWSVALHPYSEAHFATYPEELIIPCILAGTDEGDTVLDPFSGAGTTGVVCKKNNRNYIGIELNPEYIEISEKRIDECDKQIKDVVIEGKVYEQPVLF